MAKMDKVLPLTNGTNRVIEDPIPVSFTRSAAEFATEALGGYVSLKQDMQQSKRAQDAAEEKATQNKIAYAVGGVNDKFVKDSVVRQQANDAVAPEADLNIPPVAVDSGGFVASENIFESAAATVSPAVTKVIAAAATRGVNIVQAAEQGKLPPISVGSVINAEFRGLREKFPEHVPYIHKVFKEYGLDASLFSEAKDAQDYHDFERESVQSSIDDQRKRDEGYIETASTVLGAPARSMSRNELITEGMTYEKLDYDLTMAKRNLDNKIAANTLSDTERKAAETDLNDNLLSTFKTSMYNNAQPHVRMLTQLADAIARNPNDAAAVQTFQRLGVQANQLVGTWVESAVTKAMSPRYGYKGDPEKLRKELTASWGPILDIFQGDFKVIKIQTDALEAVQTGLKLTNAEALPTFLSLKSVGFRPEEIPAVMQAVQNNPKLAGALTKEVKGFITDFGADRASTHLINLSKLLRGELSLERMDPAQAGKIIPTLVDANRGLAKAYIRTPGSVDGNKILNGVGEIVTNIRSLGPSNSPTLLYVVSKSFSDPLMRQALLQTKNDPSVDKGMVQATIQASRAGNAQMLDYYRLNVADVNKTNQYFKVSYDERDGRYKVDDSRYKTALAAAGSMKAPSSKGMSGEDARYGRLADAGTVSSLKGLRAPKNIEYFVLGANMNLDNAIEMGRHDETTPKATDLQLKNWYAQNRPLPVEKSAAPTNPEVELRNALDAADKSLTQALDGITSTPVDTTRPIEVDGLKGVIIKGEAGPAGYNSVYGDTARGNAHNLSTPKPVVEMTIQEAIDWGKSVAIPRTKGKVGAGPDKGTSAIGAYQFTQGTLAEFGQKVFGHGWREAVLNAANQDKLADAIIEATGLDPRALIGRWPSLKGKL